ncbi:hypothetical protein [Streptomyces olivaceoviridis]|uniref:hypothetical protein n=1 Tax=Streptomyces olivaceoviridis TaxID=1921 RepID=UPI0036C780C1
MTAPQAVRIALTLPPGPSGPLYTALPGGRLLLSRRLRETVDTDAIADPQPEPALLAAAFCPRTW